MNVQESSLPGVLIIEPSVFTDSRGFFQETYEQDRYRNAGMPATFVQDNLSRSRRGVLRGLHFQLRRPQGKLVQVLDGEVFDVAVDLRRKADTFGRWVGAILSAENHRQIYVPPGFAHGFYVLSDSATLVYKCSDIYDPQSERTLIWNDREIGIEWPMQNPPILAEKDAAGLPLASCEVYEDDDVVA